MKKYGIAFLLCVIVIFIIVSVDKPLPETGIWYCEELDMYLDAETHTGYFRDESGEYEPLFYQVGFDQRYHINFCESQECEGYPENVKHVNMQTHFRRGILWLTDEETNIKYKFVEVDREVYPGG